MLAAVVFPYFWMLLKTWSSRRPSDFWTISAMRRFAWCGTKTFTSAGVTPAFSITLRTASGIRTMACLKTFCPSMCGKTASDSTISFEMRGL